MRNSRAHFCCGTLALCCLFLCFSFTIGKDDSKETQIALDEMRLEIGDLKHHLHSYHVQMQILEEKLRAQDQLTTTLKKENQKVEGKAINNPPLSLLEKRIAQIESRLDKIQQYMNQSTTSLTQYKDAITRLEQRLDEVSKLKGTLATISQAIQQKAQPESPSSPREEKIVKKYKVKSGDSLEKIARTQNISVATLKEINDLRSDRLTVGQELKLSNE